MSVGAHICFYLSSAKKCSKALAKRHSQFEPSYKIKTCIGGWRNDTTESSQLARNHSILSQYDCVVTKRQGNLVRVGWGGLNGGELGSSWAKIWACGNSLQLEPTQAWWVAKRYLTQSIEVVNFARVGLSGEYRWPGLMLVFPTCNHERLHSASHAAHSMPHNLLQ